jgi:Na+-translocating ferredoxin:NAD+ oxidoreductase RnfC subunit
MSNSTAAKNPYRGGSAPQIRNCGAKTCPANLRLRKMMHYEKNKIVYISRAKSRPLEEQRKYKKVWKTKNKAWVAANVASRKRHIRQATPKWLTEAQKIQIRSFYEEAERLKSETGVDYEVDHIVPLRGGIVSGLHVPWNLRVITAAENQLKNRKLLDDTETY